MSILRFDIRYPNGHREAAVVEAERALLGSASYCDIRFPVDQAAYEHVVIEVIGGTLRAEAKASHPPATINGMPLTSAALGSDSVLGIGSTQVFVTLTTEHDGLRLGVEKQKKDKGSPLIRLLGLALLIGLGYMVMAEDEQGIAPAPTDVPALFSAAAPPCPQTMPEQARAFAAEKMDLAAGKRERHPFSPADGVAAVELYRLAAACYATAHLDALAKEAQLAAQTLQDSITLDFRARRLRLEHMLALKDYDLAKKDVAVLLALTSGKQGPYVRWLAGVTEDLRRRLGQ